MVIFLCIVGELATIIGSIVIIANGTIDSYLKLADNGYRINKQSIDDYQSKKKAESKEQKNYFKSALSFISMITPGFNLVRAGIISNKMKEEFMNDPEIKDMLIPMTESEKEQYSEMKGKFEKLGFITVVAEKTSPEQDVVVIGNRPIIVDHALESLYYDSLEGTYSLEEVKKLNDSTEFSYRIGILDEVPTAIIGIPNPDSQINRIQLKNDGYKKLHNYENLREEEACDKQFVVYPFMSSVSESQELKNAIDEIKSAREKSTGIIPNQYTFQEGEYQQETTISDNDEKGPKLKLRK